MSNFEIAFWNSINIWARTSIKISKCRELDWRLFVILNFRLKTRFGPQKSKSKSTFWTAVALLLFKLERQKTPRMWGIGLAIWMLYWFQNLLNHNSCRYYVTSDHHFRNFGKYAISDCPFITCQNLILASMFVGRVCYLQKVTFWQVCWLLLLVKIYILAIMSV